jgi:hypothetical protein
VNRQSHGEREVPADAPYRRIPSVDSGTGHICHIAADTHIQSFTATQHAHVWSHRLLAPTAPVPNTGQVAMANVSEAAREAAMAASRS